MPKNCSASRVAGFNQYLVGFGNTQGTALYPYFEANTDDWCDPTNGLDRQCFQGGGDFNRLLALRKAIDADVDILDAADSLYGCEVLFDVEYNTVRHMLEYESLDGTLTTEDQDVLNSPDGKESYELATVMHDFDQVVIVPVAVDSQLTTIQGGILQMTDQIAGMQVTDTTNRSLSSMGIDTTVKKDYRSRTTEQLIAISNPLDAISTYCLSAKYLKGMAFLDIKARDTAFKGFTAAEQAYIASVANECGQY